jgi:PAS domain-containing protein
MVHREDQRALVEQAERARKGESPGPIEHRVYHKDGSLRWVRNTAVPVRNEEGVVVGYVGLVRDITARKVAEEQLVKSEGFYHSLVETLPQHIIRKDLNERFTFANQRFCALVGKRLDEIVGKTDFDFFQPAWPRNTRRMTVM